MKPISFACRRSRQAVHELRLVIRGAQGLLLVSLTRRKVIGMDWQKTFVGRDDDVKVLKAAWEAAKTGTPRVMALVAESGFGKTRLAQEFFNWLSTVEDGVESEGYWPDRLLRNEDNLRVNPDTDECGGGSKSMPFLWWGLRLADPGRRNATSSKGALTTGLDRLRPHLAIYDKTHRNAELNRRRLVGGGKAAADIALGVGETALDALASVATFGLLGLGKTVLATGVEQRGLARELRELNATDVAPGAVEVLNRDTLAETVIADLFRIAKAPPEGMVVIPVVLLIDDAQWLSADGGMVSFLDLLMKRARQERWPLLLILTSWRREWMSSAQAREAPGNLVNPAAGDVVHYLGGVDGLDTVIEQAFPGLPSEQVAQLADKAEGAPRLLDEMLMYLGRRQKFFVGRDFNAALTEAGVADVMAHDFAGFVADRLEEAPEHVRRALAIASTQGVRFSRRIVTKIAEGLKIFDSEIGLREGDDPHSFVADVVSEDSVEFRLRAYRNASANDLGNLLDEVEVDEGLKAALLEIAAVPEAATDEELALVFDFVSKPDIELDTWTPLAISAAAQMIDRASAAFDTRSAGEIAERTLPLFRDETLVEQLKPLFATCDALMKWRGPRRDALDRLSVVTTRLRTLAEEQPTPDARRSLAIALANLGGVVQALDGPAAARPLREEEVALNRTLAEEQPTPDARRDLAIALANLGGVVQALDGPAAARPLREEMVALMRTLAEEQPYRSFIEELIFCLELLADCLDAEGSLDAANLVRQEVKNWQERLS
jgi:hypothetical protein